MRSRSRLIPFLLVLGLVLAAAGSVIAASGGSSSNGSSSKDQYCPPSSPNGGNPQGGPNNNCGHPPDTCPNGQPKPPPGNCGNHATSEGLKHPNGSSNGNGASTKKKKPKFTIHTNPKRSCYSGNIGFRIGVTNRPRSHRTFAYRDGKLIQTSRSKAFKVHFNTSRLRRGNHTLTVRTRGSDGKWTTRNFRFKRC